MASNLDSSIPFRATIVKVLQKLSKKTVQEIAFIYNMEDHLEQETRINRLIMFQDIISERKLVHSDGALIAQFINVLNSLECSDLAKLLTEHCLKWDICYESPATHEGNHDKAPTCSGTTTSEVLADIEQEEHVSTTATEDTEDSSADEPQKIMGSVMFCKEKKASKGRRRVNSAASGSALKSRKKRKLDHGATDERRMMEKCYQSNDEVQEEDEPAGSHDQQDELFMKDALDEARQSPDGDVKVGTIIVNRNEGKILGRGHNRMPNGCDKLPWNDDYHDLLNSKYPYVFHSSKAALKDAFKKSKDLEGATIYTTLFPANTDAQWIAECGIKELVYLENPYRQRTFAVAAKTIFDTIGITCRKMAQV